MFGAAFDAFFLYSTTLGNEELAMVTQDQWQYKLSEVSAYLIGIPTVLADLVLVAGLAYYASIS